MATNLLESINGNLHICIIYNGKIEKYNGMKINVMTYSFREKGSQGSLEKRLLFVSRSLDSPSDLGANSSIEVPSEIREEILDKIIKLGYKGDKIYFVYATPSII